MKNKDDRIFSDHEIWKGLQESVKLQAHYAELLNMHDGGKRIIFKTAREWLYKVNTPSEKKS
jgi:hypothetical protein